MLAGAALCGCDVSFADEDVAAKPVIYLYPEEETEVSVTLDYDGNFYHLHIPTPMAHASEPVSYTHLDVYKRQTWRRRHTVRAGFPAPV